MPIIGIIASAIRKAVASFSDNFNRTTSGSLGTSSSGTAWVARTGTWTANGTVATSADLVAGSPGISSSYPLASVTMTSNSATVWADTPQATSGGAGVAFWVSDAGSWWAAVPYYSSATSYTCPSGGSLSGTTCTIGAYSYAATANTTSGYSYAATASTTYSCPSGGTLSGTSCNVPKSTTTNFGTGAGAAGACLALDPGATYSTANGGTCTIPAYTYTATASTTYSCPSGGSLSGSTCNVSGSTTYSCPSGGSLSGTTCNVSSSTYTASTVTTYTSSVQLLYSVSGTVNTQSTTAVASSGSSYPSIGSLKVVTNGNTITASAYANSGLSTQRGSNVVVTPAAPVLAPGVGIILAPGGSSQATQIDNFNATAP